MSKKSPPNYLAAYPAAWADQVRELVAQGKFADWMLKKYSVAHAVRTDRLLYDFASEIKERHLRNTTGLSRVMFDSTLHIERRALGLHTSISRVQGGNLKSKRELRVATVFRDVPLEFLRMIVVHELAHLKERDHNKAFYQLCLHMEADYHQLEFDLRAYLTYLDADGLPLWPVEGGGGGLPA
jgi:predicted metal-dependent hydrolase